MIPSTIPTPALVLDASVVRQNLGRLASYGRESGLQIRPHAKTHKLRQLAEMQLAAGAAGLTVAKVTEADAISRPGEDVLLAYPPVGYDRAERLASLARDRTVRAAVDSLVAIEAASAVASVAGTTIGLLVDLDVGMGRTGVRTSEESLLLAQAIDRAAGTRLDGIMIYPGHIFNPADEQRDALQAISQLVQETINLWERHGLAATIVSGGSTPTAYQSHLIPQLKEIRPGTYVFNDMNTVRGGYCSRDDCAARIVTTVISDAVPGQVVIDAGSKTLSSDRCASDFANGQGHVVEYPEARITRLTEEHGQIDVNACARRPKIGERVTVIPNHICPCVNLQEFVWWLEPNEPARQLKVDARGKLL